MVVRVLLLGGLFGKLLLCRSEEMDCERAVRDGNDGLAVAVCGREYASTGDPRTGIRWADSLRRTGDMTAARAVAKEMLVHAEVRGDVHQIFGKIAAAEGRTSDAIAELEKARTLHRAANQRDGLARDDQALAGIQYRNNDYTGALDTVRECIEIAEVVGDRAAQGVCHLTAARVLHTIGDFLRAQDQLESAQRLFTSEQERAMVFYEKGNLEQEMARIGRPRYRVAIELHMKVRALALEAKRSRQVLTSTLNLIYSLSEQGAISEASAGAAARAEAEALFMKAEGMLREAAQLDPNDERVLEREQLAARLAYRRKDYRSAMDRNEAIYERLDTTPDRIEVAAMQARIALATGDFEGAERWAQRGISDVEEIRRRQSDPELNPWVLASRREPYELSFLARVSAGRTEDAFLAFSHWQARALTDALAKQGAPPGASLASIADQLSSLQRLLPSVPQRTTEDRAVLEALRGAHPIDLLALAVVDGKLWRLVASQGRLQAEPLSAFDALTEQLDTFAKDATQPDISSALGKLLVPAELFHSTEAPLYVVLDAQLAHLPIAALRRDGRPLVAVRPLVRAPNLPAAARCAPSPAITHAVVVGDPKGDLEHARREAIAVASRFQTTPVLHNSAGKHVLDTVRADSLLHLSMHAKLGIGGGKLEFFDGDVSVVDISTRKLAPALVVLSACASALSYDPGMAGALTTAFLTAGTPRVVGTLRTVPDRDPAEVIDAFYEAGGVVDPVRALAKAQAKLAGTSNKVWPHFAVFAKDTCAAPAR